jgi:lipopolysaccharide export system protein LptC
MGRGGYLRSFLTGARRAEAIFLGNGAVVRAPAFTASASEQTSGSTPPANSQRPMTASATLQHDRQHTWRVRRHGGMAPAFRRARRHSRLVRVLRTGIPVFVGAAVVLYALGSWLNPLAGLNLPSISSMGISGTKITMDAPRLAGFTRDGRAYELTAAAAAQDLKRPQFIELQGVRAKMQLEDGNTVNITSEAGLYDTKGEVVTLNKNVVIVMSNGTTVHMAETTLDMRKNHVTSDKPVQVDVADGHVNAQKMEVVNGGEVVYFRGGVNMLLDRSASTSAPAASAQETRP